MPMAKARLPFTVIFNQVTKAELDELAESLRTSKGACLRNALHFFWLMHCRHVPTCASGQSCLVPQMHPTPPPAVAPPGTLHTPQTPAA